MGWNLFSVLIRSEKSISYEKLLNELDYDVIRYLPEEPLGNVLFTEENKVYLGTYKGCTIIAASNLALSFYSLNKSKAEETLSKTFPDVEVAAVSLQSAINHFGFALIRNGQKVRVKTGDSISGTPIDIGEPLTEELQLLAKSKRDAHGRRTYFLDNGMGKIEEYEEHQVSENFVFQIFKRFTGIFLNDDEDEFLGIPMIGYEIAEKLPPVTDFFTGEWRGSYMYGAGYSEKELGNIEMFTLAGNMTGYGRITGDCIDDTLRGDEPARIDGFLNGDFIGFVKKYPYFLYLDEDGKSQKHNGAKSVQISYSGLYDRLTESFSGIWQINDTSLKGTWQMVRK